MKRTYIYALIIGLFVTACNDTEVIEQNGVLTESADVFIPEGAEEGELLIKFVPEMTTILDQIAEEDVSGQMMTRSGGWGVAHSRGLRVGACVPRRSPP